MTRNGQPDDVEAITTDPDDIDGHTIEELVDYLDSGRTPSNASIDSSPACQHALAALERLNTLTRQALVETGRPATEDDARFVDLLMGQIAFDAHAGADFTLTTGRSGDVLVMTEGALRGLVRAAGDAVPGFLVGRVRFTGDLSAPTSPLTIDVRVTVLHGVVIPEAVDELRRQIGRALTRQTGFTDVRVDVTVQDLALVEHETDQ